MTGHLLNRPSTVLAALAAALISSAALADGHLDGMGQEELVAAAEAEGQVTVYSFTSRIFKVERAFEAAYPNIDLIGIDISSTEQIARLSAELAAGIANADVAYTSDAAVVFTQLVGPGWVQRYVPPRMADLVPAAYQQPLLAQRLSTKVLMYNEEANPNGPPLDNLWALTTDAWRGRVVMVDPLQRGDYLDLMTEVVLRSDEMAAAYEDHFGQPIQLDGGVGSAGEQWIANLFANDLVLVSNTDAVNAAVGKLGQDNPPVGFTSYSDRRDNEEEGWALQVANSVRPSPGIVFPAVVGVVSNARHPAAARLVIDFLMGDDSPDGGEGFKPFYVPGDYATRTDIVPHPDAVPLDEFRAWRVDPARTADHRGDVADTVLILQ